MLLGIKKFHQKRQPFILKNSRKNKLFLIVAFIKSPYSFIFWSFPLHYFINHFIAVEWICFFLYFCVCMCCFSLSLTSLPARAEMWTEKKVPVANQWTMAWQFFCTQFFQSIAINIYSQTLALKIVVRNTFGYQYISTLLKLSDLGICTINVRRLSWII